MPKPFLLLLASVYLAVYSYGIDIDVKPIFLMEDLPLGAYAFTINATGPPGQPLTYALGGDDAFYFSVARDTGSVSIRSYLDREAKRTLLLLVVVSDGQNEARRQLSIIVRDANDNPPIFDPPLYDINVPENTLPGVLFQVTATDRDEGDAKTIVYRIDNVIPSTGNDLFSINEITGNVSLMGSLNYTSKSTFYQLKINASDKGGPLNGEFVIQSSTVFASINVIDVPDLDPQFINLPYVATVDENTPVGISVIEVLAIDPDMGVNANIVYTIQSTNVPDLFEINEITGLISVKMVFDREELLDIDDIVTLKVMAMETEENVHGNFPSTTTDVKITIGDVNDNKPKFYYCDATQCDLNTQASDFSGDIDEHSFVGASVNGLNILAMDLDQGQNAKFTLHLEGPDKDAFQVSPSAGISKAEVQIQVKNQQDVDYEEKKFMIVEVVATEDSTSDSFSTATVTIQINDINDNFPTFKQDTYEIAVKEHSPIGTIIATITATDPDTEDKDNITYTLLPANILNYFDVYPSNGSIKVVDDEKIDREITSFFYATLKATDTKEKVGTTTLEITLLDINDKVPNITRESYYEFVKEGPNQQLRFKVQAIDQDEPETKNSRIQYRIEESMFSDNFTINIDTGELEKKDQLDREAINASLNGDIVLNVTATDMGEPPRGTWVKVTVNVQDINDNTPHFRDPSYEFFVKESNKGSFVGSVFADDADQTEINNRISFRIIDGSFGNFIIISSAEDTGGFIGNMSVDPDVELDYEQGQRLYTLTIEATDLGQRKDTVKVKVNVLDVNDERPTLPKDLTWHVAENTTGLGVVGKIAGGDLDSNHSLVYELISTRCYCNATMGPCDEEWFVVEPTGAVMVNEEFQVDYEKCTQVLLEVQVEDIFTEKGENTSLPAIVTINIDDINDNIPIFITPDGVFVVVSEDTEKDKSVAFVSAFDLDSGDNKVITFDILSVKFVDTNNNEVPMDVFYAETTAKLDYYEGTIRCLGSLDGNLKGKYSITVIARNKGDASATIQIAIYTIDKSYRVGLRFETSVAEVESNLDQIKGALAAATEATVRILEVVAENTEQRASEVTILGTYFIYTNGSAMDSNSVERRLQEDLYHANILRKYGLTYIVSGLTQEKEIDPVFVILLGLVAALVISLAIMITSLVCTRKSFQRKLKAAKAMNTATMLTTENRKTGAVVPGTNKYTMEGANPVLNLNIDTATDLGFDEDSSSDDIVSMNSLDYNQSDNGPMTIIQEEEEEDETSIGEQVYHTSIEPLGAALAQRDKKKDSGMQWGYDNPSLSTTDL
ncbi:cadherin-related family member 2 [Paramormyrops kingsleyae]|uniref:cadherin-related family member 2 n=1 Tax=Paramormyrops kingsleyae TaxID=1676925 RepID=UPI003B97C9B5